MSLPNESQEPSSQPQGDVENEAERVIEDVGENIMEGSLPARVLNDEALYQLELERIFAKSWVFIGHETEIPEPGDYAKRYIADSPFIFVRDEQGQIQVLFDHCRHRGSELCRSEQGNASHFRCPYHGWTYKTNGDLIGVPKKSDCYEDMENSDWGLESPPRIETYQGLVFASLNPDVPPLEEYLGEHKFYLDLQFNLTEGGMEVIGEPWRHVTDFNWKIGPENGSGDSYHLQVTHQSAIEAGYMDTDWSWKGARYNVAVNNIHTDAPQIDAYSTHIGQLELEEDFPLWGYPDEVKEALNPALSEEQLAIAKQSTVNTSSVFPNLYYIHEAAQASPDKGTHGYLLLRKARPLGPGQQETIGWVLVPKEASDEYKKKAYEAAMTTFGPSGSFDIDDIGVWKGMTETGGSLMSNERNVELNYKMGHEDVADVPKQENWEGPGDAYKEPTDGFARHFYKTWYNFMSEK